MRVRETVEVPRPQEEVFAALTEPERRAQALGWRRLERAGDAYEGVLTARSGPIAIDFDCRFSVEGEDRSRVRIKGTGASPRLAFAVDATFSLRGVDGRTTVELDADVGAAGELAGLGQRRLGEQARRLLAAYVAA
jgi:carbon monoxide dehydrogenase subunit G